MAYSANAYVVVDPSAPPQAPYGLFNVAPPQPLPRIEAEYGGLEYQPDTCGITRLWNSTCDPITSKIFDEGVPTVYADPFVVYTSWLCGSIGYSVEEIRSRLLTRLSLKEQMGVEQRLWGGYAGQSIEGLFHGADVVDLGDAGCVTAGISALEQTLADNGVVGGIIHARPGLSSWLSRDHLVDHPSTRLMTTPYGTPYSFGYGYDGSAPQGTAPTGTLGETTEWIYATGRVQVWRGDVGIPTIREILNRSTNQQYALAERPYLVGVECGIWAVQVTTECAGA